MIKSNFKINKIKFCRKCAITEWMASTNASCHNAQHCRSFCHFSNCIIF